MRRVYGPDYMIEMCRRITCNQAIRHFLYSGAPGVAEKLKNGLTMRMPCLRTSGTYTPALRTAQRGPEKDLIAMVEQVEARHFLGGPEHSEKQQFMSRYSLSGLEVKLMAGVGAAFDLHAGLRKDAPNWIKLCGLQWLHRLRQEPRRLGPRYLQHNPRFFVVDLSAVDGGEAIRTGHQSEAMT